MKMLTFLAGLFSKRPAVASAQNLPVDQLPDIAFLALDHGISSIEDGDGPLVPFVLSEKADHSRKLDRYLADTWEESLRQARISISKLPSEVTLYALAYDGNVTLEGVKCDAILVEASERKSNRAMTLAQRYVPKTDRQAFQRVGNPILMGKGGQSSQ